MKIRVSIKPSIHVSRSIIYKITNEKVKSYRIVDKAIMNSYGVPGPFMKGRGKYQELTKLLEDYSTKTGKHYLKPCTLMRSGEFLKIKG